MQFKSLTGLWQAGLCCLLALFVFSACTVQQQKDANMLPPARGGKGEIILVMDSLKWNGALGDAVREVFQEAVDGLPQPEPIFSLTFVTASKFQSILRQGRNIVVVTTFDSDAPESVHLQRNFTPESREQVMQNDSIFSMKKQNEYAAGQLVLHLFSKEEGQLIAHLKANKKALQRLFNERENDEVRSKLLDSKALNRAMSDAVAAKHGLRIKIPKGYTTALDTTGFMWLRYVELTFDKNLIIAHQPYRSEAQFEQEALVAWRDSLGIAHIYGDRENKPESYMMTERQVPVTSAEVSIAGGYGKEIRGLWRLKEVFMGGGFVGYAFADTTTGRLYYIEGFLAAPGTKKREHMRELELVLKSVKALENQ